MDMGSSGGASPAPAPGLPQQPSSIPPVITQGSLPSSLLQARVANDSCTIDAPLLHYIEYEEEHAFHAQRQ